MTTTAPPPERIGGFRVVGLLGRGAMGEVWEAVDERLNRRVAIKLLGTKHRGSAEFRTRFVREGRAMAAMNHPNVVQIYATGEHEDRPYLAMEFLDGDDIGVVLKSGGPIHQGDAALMVHQAAIGLREASRCGVVHRDVKPSNMVITQGGVLKVTDFGLAKALQEDLSITATGVFVGTPDYLAPEQAMGDEVDAGADIYALGCSLYHMVTGRPPFRTFSGDDHYTSVVRRHLKADRPELIREVDGVDPELSAMCRCMMSRRPDVRPDFDRLIEQSGEIARRLSGRIPPRHVKVTAPTMTGPISPVTQDAAVLEVATAGAHTPISAGSGSGTAAGSGAPVRATGPISVAVAARDLTPAPVTSGSRATLVLVGVIGAAAGVLVVVLFELLKSSS